MSNYPTQVVEFQGQPVRLIRIGGVHYIPAEDLGREDCFFTAMG